MNPANDKENPLPVDAERGRESNNYVTNNIPDIEENVNTINGFDSTQENKIIIKCNIDNKPYDHKPEGKEIGGVCNSLKIPERIFTGSVDTLAKAITGGFAFSQGIMIGTKAEHSTGQQLFVIDIDNGMQGQATPDLKNYPSGFLPDLPEVTLKDALEICKLHGLIPAIVYYSFNHLVVSADKNPRGWSRYRLVFATAEPITDLKVAVKMSKGLISLFSKQCDQSTYKLEQMYFGTDKGLAMPVLNVTIDPVILLDLYNEREVQEEKPVKEYKGDYKPQGASYEGTVDLQREYERFNLLSYIEQTTGRQGKKRGKDTLINPCPICGHNDDFYVDTERNLFKCHSSADGRGGNILTYLMITMGLDAQAARDYFKEKCLGIDLEAEKTAYRAAYYHIPPYTDADAPPDNSDRSTHYEQHDPTGEPQQEPRKSVLKSFSDIEEKDPDFLWYPYIRRGAITTVTATQGTGKSMLMCKLAAMLSRGERTTLPFFDRWWKYKRITEPEKTIYLNAEDDPAEDTKGRLRICGANPDHVYYVPANELGLNFYDPRIEEWIIEAKPTLLIFDPVQQFFSGNDPSGAQLDMNSSASVRPIMTRLNVLANKYNIAIILICHPNKNSGYAAIHSTMGSNDFTAAPRSAIYIGRNPDDKEQRIITVVKANSVPERDQKSLEYRIDFHDGGVSFEGESQLQADDVRDNKRNRKKPEGEDYKPAPKRSEAEAFLTNLLEDNDYRMLFRDIEKAAIAAKISMSSVQRAKKNSGFIKHTTQGNGKPVYWYYEGHEPPE